MNASSGGLMWRPQLSNSASAVIEHATMTSECFDFLVHPVYKYQWSPLPIMFHHRQDVAYPCGACAAYTSRR